MINSTLSCNFDTKQPIFTSVPGSTKDNKVETDDFKDDSQLKCNFTCEIYKPSS